MTFKTISIKNIKEIKTYLDRAGNRGCTFTAGNILIWGEELPLTYTVLMDVLVFCTLSDKDAVYHISRYTEKFPDILDMLSEDAGRLGKRAVFADLSREMAEELSNCRPGEYLLEYDRDGSDYVYEVQALANLRGKRYHKKKNHVNRFLKNHRFLYEEITPENRQECLDMAEEWMASRQADASLLEEKKAIRRAFRYYDQLMFTGGLLRVDGRVMAFTLGERATEDTFVTHFEKALDGIPELYAVMNQQFAKNQLGGYQYVNREEDLGLPGLRKAKTSYHPAFLVEKYRAVPRAGLCENAAGSRQERIA